MKSFKEFVEEVAANSVAGGGVDFTPTDHKAFFRRNDKRKKYSTENMYKKSLGLKHIGKPKE